MVAYSKKADVIVEPPSNGLLWDLSWDLDFECHNSDMFKTFASLFVDKTSSLDPVGCFIVGRTEIYAQCVGSCEEDRSDDSCWLRRKGCHPAGSFHLRGNSYMKDPTSLVVRVRG